MVRLIVYNIEYCTGLTGKFTDYLKFWRYIKSSPKLASDMIEYLKKKKPDILALVEVDSGTFRTDHTDEGIIFKKHLELTDIDETPQYSFTSGRKYLKKIPYLCKQTNAFLSKYPLKNITHHFLSAGTHNVVIQTSVNCPKKVTFLLAHLALNKRARKKQLEELTNIIKKIKNPIILMGDFNTFKGSQELNFLLKNSKLYDAVKMNHQHLTFPAFKPKRRLDYVLVSKEIAVKKYQVLPVKFSDHLPVMMDFTVDKEF